MAITPSLDGCAACGGGEFTGLTDTELRATPVEVEVVPGTQFGSVSGYGSATAPAAGATVATIASGSLPAGYYEITADVRLDGTTGTGERDNFELRRGAVVLSRLLIADVADASPGFVRVYATLSGAEALTVNAVGAGTAGAVYSANIVATRLS